MTGQGGRTHQPEAGWETSELRKKGKMFSSPVLLYLPCNQVLEMAQLVLVLGVVPGVLFSEEGLWGGG